MKRRVDWAKALNATIEAQAGEPFSWQDRNCLSVVCDCIAAMTGEDPLEPYRPLYHDEASAMAVVAEHGDLFGFVAHLLGQPMDNPRFARNGDVFCVRLLGGPTCGIAIDTAVWALEQQGMLALPKARVFGLQHAAWPIGWGG